MGGILSSPTRLAAESVDLLAKQVGDVAQLGLKVTNAVLGKKERVTQVTKEDQVLSLSPPCACSTRVLGRHRLSARMGRQRRCLS